MTILNSMSEEYLVGKLEYFTFLKASKKINKKGLGRNNLLKLLRGEGWLDQWNCPTNNHLASIFIKTVENKHLTPLISNQGISYIKNELLKNL